MTAQIRELSPIDQLANDYMQKQVALSPESATFMGIPGYDHLLSDYGPDGVAAQCELEKNVLADLAKLPVQDQCDELTKGALEELLGLSIELHEAKETLGTINVIASPLQNVRDIFDIMPTQSQTDWENIASRLAAVPEAIESYAKGMRAKIGVGPAPALRQVEASIKQCLQTADTDSSPFITLIRPALENTDLPVTIQAKLTAAAANAREAYRTLARTLSAEIAPIATEVDGVGKDRYARFSRSFLGTTVDLQETYDWGAYVLAEIIKEQQAVAKELYGAGVSVQEAMQRLNADPAYTLHGTEALQQWMQEKANQAISSLSGKYFDIPEQLQRIDCKIAPSGTGGIYYTGPSDDLTRPGAMWWSVPPGTTEFATWNELTTVYHEGVPGHHLQIGLATYNRAELNDFRRQGCWVSGYGEGWALYAERLMDELGFLDNPANRMGMLDAQHLRAARVVLDIGLHLGLPMHNSYGDGIWDYEKAWDFLCEHVAMERSFLKFELDRYAGWPGQAPSYKVGQRIWEQERDFAKQRAQTAGQTFDIKAWHMSVLNKGALPLCLLPKAATL